MKLLTGNQTHVFLVKISCFYPRYFVFQMRVEEYQYVVESVGFSIRFLSPHPG